MTYSGALKNTKKLESHLGQDDILSGLKRSPVVIYQMMAEIVGEQVAYCYLSLLFEKKSFCNSFKRIFGEEAERVRYEIAKEFSEICGQPIDIFETDVLELTEKEAVDVSAIIEKDVIELKEEKKEE